VSVPEVDALRATLVEVLRSAHAASRGVSPAVEPAVRAHARAMREAGISIAQTLVEVKSLVREHTGHDEPIFTPKVVGWTVAGYFDGTSRST
jgi:hypothetical protein